MSHDCYIDIYPRVFIATLSQRSVQLETLYAFCDGMHPPAREARTRMLFQRALPICNQAMKFITNLYQWIEWVLSFMVHTFQVTTVLQSSVLIDSLLVNPTLLFCGNYKKVHGSNTYRGCVHMSKAGKILSNFTSSIAPLRTISPLCK